MHIEQLAVATTGTTPGLWSKELLQFGGHIMKANTRLVILRFSQRRSLERRPTLLAGEQTSANSFLMGLSLFSDMVSFLRSSSWNSNLCHNMDARGIVFIGILLLTEQGAPYQVRASAVVDHIVGLSGA